MAKSLREKIEAKYGPVRIEVKDTDPERPVFYAASVEVAPKFSIIGTAYTEESAIVRLASALGLLG